MGPLDKTQENPLTEDLVQDDQNGPLSFLIKDDDLVQNDQSGTPFIKEDLVENDDISPKEEVVTLEDTQKKLIEIKKRDAFGRRIAHRLKDQSWRQVITEEYSKKYWKKLVDMLAIEHNNHSIVFPPEELIFNAFNLCPLDSVKVVILGQDPYHGFGQAMGLSFSVPYGALVPPSLKNIYKELKNDIELFQIPNHGNLTEWATQGVLLLNAVLTVRKGEPDSHAGKGWENFTDQVIKVLNERKENLVFLLWGNKAQAKSAKINQNRHCLLKTAHPSPLSSQKFFGCKHFSKANEYLIEHGLEPINWTLEQYVPSSPSKKRTRDDLSENKE